MQNPTSNTELNTVLTEFAQSIQAILKDKLVGVYLQGSFSVGDPDMNSDVDFIVIIDSELTDEEVQTLQENHRRIHDMDNHWAKHLEGSFVPKSIFAQYEDCSYKLWYLDNGSRTFEQSTHCNTVLVRWVVRDMSTTLLGADPKTLLEPIPVKALRQEIFDVIHDWGKEILADPERFANQFYQIFILHNYSRMLQNFIEGKPGSKLAGTEWAKANLDPKWHELIDRSWQTRDDTYISVYHPADPDDYQATLEFVRYIIDESEKYRHLL